MQCLEFLYSSLNLSPPFYFFCLFLSLFHSLFLCFCLSFLSVFHFFLSYFCLSFFLSFIHSLCLFVSFFLCVYCVEMTNCITKYVMSLLCHLAASESLMHSKQYNCIFNTNHQNMTSVRAIAYSQILKEFVPL